MQTISISIANASDGLKVLILGTANAWGPNELAGTVWPMKGLLADRSTEVEIRRYRTSLFFITSDGKRILVDCGPDFSHQRREFNLDRIDALLITHPHRDHIGGLDELNIYKRAGHPSIPTYAHPDCWNSILSELGFEYIVRLGILEKQELTPYKEFQIGAAWITAFPVEHSKLAPGSVGFVIEDNGTRVLYTGDLWALSDPNHRLFHAPLDLLIMECDRWDGLAGPRVGGGHMSFKEAVRWLKDGPFSDPRPMQVMFVHLGDHGPNDLKSTYQDWRQGIVAELERNQLQSVMPDQDIIVAYDGLMWQPQYSSRKQTSGTGLNDAQNLE